MEEPNTPKTKTTGGEIQLNPLQEGLEPNTPKTKTTGGEIQLNPLQEGLEKTRTGADDDVEKELPSREDCSSVEAAVDAAIEASGFGRYQTRLCVISGLLWAADSMEVSLLSFLYECAGASLDLTPTQAASIVSVVFAGELVGAAIAGPIADAYGRRPVLLAAASVVAVFGLLTAAAPSLWALLACRFLVGVAIGGLAVPFDLMAEFLPVAARGTQLNAIEFAWAAGALYATGAAWLTLESHSWRLLVLVCGLPFVVVCLAVYAYVDESPRWLAETGKTRQLEAVLTRVHSLNNNSSKSTTRTIDAVVKAAAKSIRRPRTKTGVEAFRDVASLLTRTDLRKHTLLLWVVWLGFGMGFYGVSLLATRLFNKNTSNGFECDFNYGFVVGVTTSEIAGTAVLMLLIDRIGRVRSQSWSYLTTALSLAPVPFLLHRPVAVFACLYVALGSMMSASNASWVHVAEIYPTDIRSTGHSIVLTVSRLSAFSSSYVVDSTLPVTTVCAILAAVSLMASLASLGLPETYYHPSSASSSSSRQQAPPLDDDDDPSSKKHRHGLDDVVNECDDQ